MPLFSTFNGLWKLEIEPLGLGPLPGLNLVLDAKQTTEDFLLADFLAFKYVWSILKRKTSKTETSDCVPASIAKEARGCVLLGQRDTKVYLQKQMKWFSNKLFISNGFQKHFEFRIQYFFRNFFYSFIYFKSGLMDNSFENFFKQVRSTWVFLKFVFLFFLSVTHTRLTKTIMFHLFFKLFVKNSIFQTKNHY